MPWLMRWRFSISANRTWPSPPGPNPTPGDTATWASRTSFDANSIESMCRYGSGILAHTNMVPLGGSTSQPMRLRPSHRASRRRSYTAQASSG